MKLPQIKFQTMTLEDNIELVKWAYFENNNLLDIHTLTVNYFPELADLDPELSKEEIDKLIERVVTEEYQKQSNKIEKEAERYNHIWEPYNDKYFKALMEYLNIEWPNNKLEVKATVGLIPVFPRYLDSFGFSVSTGVPAENIIGTSAHETLHFLWFEKWKKLFPECPRKEFDSPYLPWQYSEMVPDFILNSEEINKIINVKAKSYSSFYEWKYNGLNVMEQLRIIYKNKISIDDKIISGYQYIMTVLSNDKY